MNGRLIGVTDSTPDSRTQAVEQRPASRLPISPTTAIAVRPSRTLSYGVRPSDRIVALDAKDLGLTGADGHHDEHRGGGLLVGRSGQTKKQRSCLCLVRPARPVPSVSDREPSCRAQKVEVAAHAWPECADRPVSCQRPVPVVAHSKLSSSDSAWNRLIPLSMRSTIACSFASSSTCSSMNHWRNWWPRWSPAVDGVGGHPVELAGHVLLGLERALGGGLARTRIGSTRP